VQAHHRAERGTSCWLRGECSEPNAYRYDAGIAADLQQAFAAAPGMLEGSSLWLTVQGRVVYLEGCVPDAARATALEALARARPGVQQALALVRLGPRGALPYRPLY
jgi:osmotically-inducible protein OsmY